MSIKFKCNPLKEMYVTSPFGMRLHPVDKVLKYHTGVDLRAHDKTTLYAVDEGEVVACKVNNGGVSKGLGYYMVIQHQGFYVVYGHMFKLGLSVGTKVKAGHTIGLSGNSGKSEASHLHFELRLGKYDSAKSWVKGKDGNYSDAIDPTPSFFIPKPPMEEWEVIVRAKMADADSWVAFVDYITKCPPVQHDVARFMKQFIVKLKG